jgi:hypothetical protein
MAGTVGGERVFYSRIGVHGPLAKSKHVSSGRFIVEMRDGDIHVGLPDGRFTAVYYKAVGQPRLILRQRTKTDDHELLVEAWKAAINKARELRWIV